MANRPQAAARESDSDGVELFESFRRDPSALLEAVYERYAALVYGVARAALSDDTEAEDLTHEIFVSMLTRCEYDSRRGTPSAYLVTLARSRAIDRLLARGRASQLVARARDLSVADVAPPPDPQHQVAVGQSRIRVKQALERLPDRQREVLELAYFKGMSQSEIAASIDAPLGSVKDWTRRGLFAMRRELGDLID